MIVTVKRILYQSLQLQIDTPGSSGIVQNLGNDNGLLNVAVSRRSGAWQSCFAMVYPGALDDTMYPETFPPDSFPLQAAFGGNTLYQGTVQVWELTGAQAALQGQRTVTLVVWPDIGEPAAVVLNVTMLGGFATTNLPVVIVPIPIPVPVPVPVGPPGPAPAPSPAPTASGPEITVAYDGTIPLQIFPAMAGIVSCKAIVYPGDIPDAHIPRQAPAQGSGATSFTQAGGFQGSLPVGAVKLNQKLAKTLVIWPDQGDFDPLVIRFNAVFNAMQYDIPVRAKGSVWFAWAADGAAAGGHPADVHRPSRLAVPLDATKMSLQASNNWNPDNGVPCDANGRGNPLPLQPASLGHFKSAGLQSNLIADISAPKGALVGVWGVHPAVPTTEFLAGALVNSLPVPKAAPSLPHVQPSYLFLGLHDLDVWTDNSDDTIRVMVFWDTTPVPVNPVPIAGPGPGPVIINENELP